MVYTNFKDGVSSFGLPLPFPTKGKTFFVDLENGSDGYRGKDPQHAFLTLQKGVDACTSDNGDVVYVMGSGTITDAVEINKTGISIIGIPFGGGITGRDTRISSVTDSISLLNVQSPKVLIQNIRLICNGDDNVGIDLTGGSTISQATFRDINIAKTAGLDANVSYGIKTGNPSACTFENIQIVGSPTARFGEGIHQTGSRRSHYKGLYLAQIAYHGIYNPASVDDVYEDVRILPSVGVGYTITGTSSAMINCRNVAATEGVSTIIKSGGYLTFLNTET